MYSGLAQREQLSQLLKSKHTVNLDNYSRSMSVMTTWSALK